MKKTIPMILIFVLPLAAAANIMEGFDDPIPGLSNNGVLDIIIHNIDGQEAIWMATGRGVSFTLDGGINWQFYDSSNGLLFNDITAIFSPGERLWVAINKVSPLDEEVLEGEGLVYTDNGGFTWNLVEAPGSVGFQYNVFDIAGYDSLVFFTSLKGGLLGSWDNGQNWKNIYYTRDDSIYAENFPFTNRYFSAVADTFHQDSAILWAGTADGLIRYIYSPPETRPSSNYIFDITAADSFVFISGDSGFTRLQFIDGEEDYRSSFESDGLPGTAVTTAYQFGDRLFVGTLDSLNGDGAGMAISDDYGLSFHTDYAGLDDVIGADKYPVEFAAAEDYLFMAAFKAGLYKSADTGVTWEKVTLDTDPASGRNIVNSVAADSNIVWLGTDSGLVKLTLDLENNAAISVSQNFVFVDGAESGGRAYKVSLQRYFGDDEILDSTVVWTIQHPLDPDVGNYAVYYSPNDGANWGTDDVNLIGVKYFDIDYINPSVILSGYSLINISQNRINWQPINGGQIYDSSFAVANTFDSKNILAVRTVSDTIFLGSEYGMAVSPPSGSQIKWHMVIADRDPTHYYRSDRFTVDDGLSGNFVIALDVQYVENMDTLLWVSSRPGANGGGQDGIAVSSINGTEWDIKYQGSPCWNMAFSDEGVFAATDAGLLFSSDGGDSWDTLTITGNLVNFEEPVEYTVTPGTQVVALLNAGDTTLWVGTEEGAASIRFDNLGGDDWNIYRVYDPSEDVYAYPVPFSPYDGNSQVTFHYPVPRDAYATIEVYDFSMELVKKVIDGEFRPGGEGIISSSDRWNGKNGRGAIVAAGIYYFKISLSTGETYWGKLAIIP